MAHNLSAEAHHTRLAICQYLSETKDNLYLYSLFRNHTQENLSIGMDPILVLDVMFQDAGQYKCRVDYHLQQTSFQLLDLSVIVPPSPPLILHNNQPGISPD